MPAVSGGAKPIEVLPAAVTGTAQSIAGEVSRSAQPGPVPMPAGGISPIDVAANAVAVAVAENVAHCSATLAPEDFRFTLSPILPDADGFNEDDIKLHRIKNVDDCRCRARDPAKVAASGDRANKDARTKCMLLHADAVA